MFGLDSDLDDAAKQSVKEMNEWIVSQTGIHKDEANSLCSFACDLHITQTVNNVKGVHAMLPKQILAR
jgi:acetamidase/formamidase